MSFFFPAIFERIWLQTCNCISQEPTRHNYSTFFSGVAPAPALAVRNKETLSASTRIHSFSGLNHDFRLSRCLSIILDCKKRKLMLMCLNISAQCDLSVVMSPRSSRFQSCMFVYHRHSEPNIYSEIKILSSFTQCQLCSEPSLFFYHSTYNIYKTYINFLM